jgi:hypothetical protein
MHRIRMRRAYTTAVVATLAGLALGAAPQARADALTTATYQLKASDGRTIQQGDCLTDSAAAATSFCQSLIARNDGSRPAQSGSWVLQWLRDARATGAAAVIFTEAGDGFDGRTTYTVPANDTSSYRMTTVGSYPPSTRVRSSSYEITSINAMAAVSDCLSGIDTSQVKTGPYGPFCVVDDIHPVARPRGSVTSAKKHHGKLRKAASRRR